MRPRAAVLSTEGVYLTRLALRYLRVRARKGLLDLRFAGRAALASARWVRGAHDAPLISTVAITSRCPLQCAHCSSPPTKDASEPSRARLERTIDHVVALGCRVLALTGGEPLARPELGELIERIPPAVTAMIYTSGVGLDEALAARLRARANLIVCLSLDHCGPAEHDRRRGFPGAAAAVERALRLLRGGQAAVHLSTLVTGDRLDSGELSQFIHARTARDVQAVQIFEPRPVGRLGRAAAIGLSATETRAVARVASTGNRAHDAPLVVAYPAIEQPALLGCCGGYSRLFVDAAGRVRPCDFAPVAFGRVDDTPLPELWRRMRAFFQTPGSRCLAHVLAVGPDAPAPGQVVDVAHLAAPELLRTPPPALYCRHGATVYRALAGNLTAAAVAAMELDD